MNANSSMNGRTDRRGKVAWFVAGVALTVLGATAGAFVGSRAVVSDDLSVGSNRVQNVVRAEHFELIDQEGRVRAELRMSDNEAVLTLFDPDGKDLFVLGAGDGEHSSPGLYFSSPDDKGSLYFGIEADGSPEVSAHWDGHGGASLTFSGDHGPAFTLDRPRGGHIRLAYAEKDLGGHCLEDPDRVPPPQGPRLEIGGGTWAPGAILGTLPDGNFGMQITTPGEQRRIVQQVSPEGLPQLRFFDQASQVCAEVGELTSASGAIRLQKDAATVWTAPKP